MTEDLVESGSSVPERNLLRGWRSVMFAPVGDGQRRRRGSDGVRLAVAVVGLLCALLVRVSWTTLIMVIGTLIGGWALVGVLRPLTPHRMPLPRPRPCGAGSA